MCLCVGGGGFLVLLFGLCLCGSVSFACVWLGVVPCLWHGCGGLGVVAARLGFCARFCGGRGFIVFIVIVVNFIVSSHSTMFGHVGM